MISKRWLLALLFLVMIAAPVVSEAQRRRTVRAIGSEAGDVILIRGIAGEVKIRQNYENGGENIRTDPNGEINTRSDTYFPGFPLRQRTNVHPGGGADTIRIRVYISAKPNKIADNANGDGVIDFSGNGVAGENDNVHDHWVDGFGVVRIYGFSLDEDSLVVRGHTVTRGRVRNIGRHTYIDIVSDQGGGGGAHDTDRLGRIILDRVSIGADDVDEILTLNKTNDGIVETVDEFAELVEVYTRHENCTRRNRGRRGRVRCENRTLRQTERIVGRQAVVREGRADENGGDDEDNLEAAMSAASN